MLLAVAAMAGCATTKHLTFTSEPSGASVQISDQLIGHTPISTDFDARQMPDPSPVLVKLDGYKSARGSIRSSDTETAYHYVLDKQVTVQVEHQGSVYRGRGVSTDSVEASAKAFLDAINRIVALTNGGK